MSDKEQSIPESWEDNAAAWVEAIHQGRIESRVRATNAAVVSAVREGGGARVLDIGCGEGWLCRAVAEVGMMAVGFDGSAALIAEAEKLGGGEYQVLSYEEFAADPFRIGGVFSTAICNYSLLGEDVLPILRGAAAVLEPGGRLIVQTLHPFTGGGADDRYEDGWRVEDFSGMGSGFRTCMPWYFRTVGSRISQIRLAGLQLEECREPIISERSMPASLLLIAASPGRSI